MNLSGADGVSRVLKEHGIAEDVVESLYGQLQLTQSNIVYTMVTFVENGIDGELLLSLIGDLEEFKYLVPLSSTRMKIKLIVNEVSIIIIH